MKTATVFRPLTLAVLATAAALALGACDDDELPAPDAARADGGAADGSASVDGVIGVDDGAVAGADAAALDAGADGGSIGGMVNADAAPAVIPGGIVVVNSDYKSTSVSLLDPRTGALTRDDCINSGSKPPGLSLALSGDVVLPSAAQPGHEVLLIDRTNSALTYLDPATCAVTRQVAVGTGFFSNPQDVVALGPTKAYVLRYERNDKPTPDPADLDDGDDILVIDPSQGRALSRIALGSYASTAGVLARPAHAVMVGGKVYVGLDSVSTDFATVGAGRVVIIDPGTDAVTGTIDLPGLKSCNGLESGPGGSSLVVTCEGSFSDANQADGSGIVLLDVSQNPPTVQARLTAQLFAGRAVFRAGLTGGTTGLAVTAGTATATPPDRLWSWDARGGVAVQLLESKESYVLGKVLWDATNRKAFVTDATASAPRVLVFDVSGLPMLAGQVVSSPARGLPPRELAFY
jgi:hypothetical protein